MPRILLALLPLAASCTEYDLSREGERPDAPEDTDEPVTDVGPQADIEVDPLTVDFGTLPKECLSDPEVVTVTNVGDADLDVTDIRLVGDGKSAFAHTGVGQLLEPGGSFTFEVEFTPAAYTDYSVEIAVTSDDPDEPEVGVGLLGTGAEEALYEEQFEQPDVESVDVLWIIDNSCSMSSSVDSLVANLHTFIDSFLALDVDWQMGVVTTDMDDPAHQGRLQGSDKVIHPGLADPVGSFMEAAAQGSSGSGDERGTDAAYTALTEPLLSGDNAGLVREGGMLAMVIITDETDGSSVGQSTFISWLDAFKGDASKTSFSAMAGPESGWFPCTDMSTGVSAEPTPRYAEIVKKTGGFYTELCDMDFTEVMTYLSYTAMGLETEFVLSETPSSPGQIEVSVDGVDVDYGYPGFTYDSTANSIVFNGDAVPGPKAIIDVRYPIPAECE